MIKKHIKFYLLMLCVLTAILFGGFVSYAGDSSVKAKPTLEISHIIGGNATITTPSSDDLKYDLRDYIHIGVENQNPYGICYAYASLTSLETYLALNYGEYYDFSELHFAISLYKQAGYHSSIDSALNDGGNFIQFITYTQKYNSLVLEEEMPMNKYLSIDSDFSPTRLDAMLKDYSAINDNFYPIVKVNNTKTFDSYVGDKSQYDATKLTTFRNSVKQHIIDNGSVTAGIYSGPSFNQYTTDYRVTNPSLVATEELTNKNMNHLVSIVGWDDTYKAAGWPNSGAYICLNSWGEGFGDNGCFYVSYDDYFIEKSIQGVSDASLCSSNNQINTISNNPQKTFIITHSFNYEDFYYVDIIDVSQHKNQSIEYIDSFVEGSNTSFYIKFYNNKPDALNDVNNISVMDLKNSTKVGDYSVYDKYQLSSPLAIGNNNYMSIVTRINNARIANSLGGFITDGQSLNLPVCYYTNALGNFSLVDDYRWNPSIEDKNSEATLPIVIHLNKGIVNMPRFESGVDSFIDSTYIQNNAIFYGKTITLDFEDDIFDTSQDLDVTISKLPLGLDADVSDNFSINISSNQLNITMSEPLNSTFGTGNYLITIPCGDTRIYRVISVQDVVGYPITYHLNGGVATNPMVYTNKHTSLSLASPIKAGYQFVGWYTDELLTQVFDNTQLPYVALDLYAKYDFAAPTAVKSNDVNTTYNKNNTITIQVVADHALKNEYNTISYQWYYRKNTTKAFTLLDGKTDSFLLVSTVADSGYYSCEVSITIVDPNMTTTPCVKTLNAGANNQIVVNIKPLVFDMSAVVWTYSSPIAYDGQSHTVELANVPEDISVTYTNNQFTMVGVYTASAELVYDKQNAIANPVDDLVWQIRKAKISITLDDIISTESIPNEILNTMYNCSIEHEYLPEGVNTKQDIINFIELNYILEDTPNQYIKIINISHKAFEGTEDVYDIVVTTAEYRVVLYNLSNNNISSNNAKGFAKDCQFSAKLINLSEDNNKLLTEQHLSSIQSYQLTYSYFVENDIASVNIPLSRQQLLNKLVVYAVQDGKLVKLDSTINNQSITFNTSLKDATYIIATEDYSHTNNTQMIIIVCVIGAYIALCVYAFISGIKHKNDY